MKKFKKWDSKENDGQDIEDVVATLIFSTIKHFIAHLLTNRKYLKPQILDGIKTCFV